MRRLVVVSVMLGVGLFVVRTRVPKLHERLMEHCERIFERMPDTFPPKRMMCSIEESRAQTARILELLEACSGKKDEAPGVSMPEAVHDAA